MKLLVVSSVFPPNVVGGAENSAYALAVALQRAGHEVGVLTMAESNEAELWGEPNGDGLSIFRLRFPRKETTFGAHKRPMGRLEWKIWHLQDFLDWRMLPRIKKILDDFSPDRVNIHLLDGIGFNILTLLKGRSISVSFFLHDLSVLCTNASMFKDGRVCDGHCRKCSLVASVKSYFLSGVENLRFVSPSEANLAKVRRYLPLARRRPGLVLRNIPDKIPEDIGNWQPSKDGTIRLMFAGRLHPTKGIDLLLEALAPLKDKYRFRLSIYGRGEMEVALKERFGRESWVHFAGFVPAEEVVRAIIRHDIVCTPSIWAEVYGRVTAQALMMGIPVIGSDIGGTSELVRHNVTGLLLQPGDVSAWREGIESILSNPSILNHFIDNARAYSGEFNVNDIVRKYERFTEGS